MSLRIPLNKSRCAIIDSDWTDKRTQSRRAYKKPEESDGWMDVMFMSQVNSQRHVTDRTVEFGGGPGVSRKTTDTFGHGANPPCQRSATP